MNDFGWIIPLLGGVILLLIGIILADVRQRITRLEERFDRHDEWGSTQAQKLSSVESAALGLPNRFDRLDHRLDLFDNKLDSLIRREHDTN